MNVEQDLSRELTTVAASVTAPPTPDIGELVRLAEREQHRSRRTVVAAAGLVAAAVVGVFVLAGHLGDPSASPDPAPQPTETPSTFRVGAPLQTWVDRYGRLNLGGTTVAGEGWANAVTTGDVTTASRGEYDTGNATVFLDRVPIGTVRRVQGPDIEVSPDHRTLAWTAYDDASRDRASVVVARISPSGIQELGRLPLPTLVRSYDDEERETLYDVADDGTVRYGGVLGGHSWKPGGTPRAADTSEFRRRPAGYPRSARDVRPNPDRTWGAWQTDEVPPLGDDDVTYTSIVAQRPGDPGSRVRFAFAGRFAYVNIVFWETETDVILYADDNPPGQTSSGRYLRCDVVAHACEVAPEPAGSDPAP